MSSGVCGVSLCTFQKLKPVYHSLASLFVLLSSCFLSNPDWCRLAARSALPVCRFAEIWSHVRPVVREGELLRDQRLQDFTHQPPVGAHVRHQSGPQRPAAQSQPAAVSTAAPAARVVRSNPRRSKLSVCVCLHSSPSHPDQQLWRVPWRQEERRRLTTSPRGEPPVCYVSSEHCYQKPGASWEKAVKQEDDSEEKVETETCSSAHAD